jgi:hypothetical protein
MQPCNSHVGGTPHPKLAPSPIQAIDSLHVPPPRNNWTVLDPSLASEWKRIRDYRLGEAASISDSSNDQKTLLLTYSGAQARHGKHCQGVRFYALNIAARSSRPVTRLKIS